MLTNSNRLGSNNQVSAQWNGGIIDPRTHHGAKVNGRFPDYLDNNNAVAENGYNIGRYTGQSAFVSGQDGTMANIFVNNDGTRLYLVGTTNDRIYQYSLTIPYLTVGGTYTTFVNFFAFGTTVVDPTGLHISPDGTKLFVLGSAADTVYSYTFGTPWDVTTLTYDSKSFSVTTQEATPRGLAVKPDGTKFWIVGTTNDTVYEYTMSTAWDLATASYASVSLSVTAQDTSPGAICWNSTGSHFTVLGRTNNQVYEYTAATAWTVAGATTALVSGTATNVVPLGNPTAISGYYFVPGTKYHYVVDNGLDVIYTWQSRVVDRLSSGVNSNRISLAESFSLGLATPRTIYFEPDGSSFFVSDGTTSVIRKYACVTPWSITSPTLVKTTYIQGRTSTSLFTSAASRFWFAPDGTSIFLQDFSTGNLSEYGLRVAWDVDQMFFIRSATGALATSSNGWCFSRDGLSLYYTSGTTFYRKTMTTAWDIGTLSGTATSFSDANFLGGTNTLMAIAISQDGRYLYGLTGASARVFKYILTTLWDITTAVFVSHAYIEDIVPDPNGGLFFSPNGGIMYVTDQTNDSLYRWTLNGEG